MTVNKQEWVRGLLLPFCAMHRDVLVTDKKQKTLLEIQILWSQNICEANGEDPGFPIGV